VLTALAVGGKDWLLTLLGPNRRKERRVKKNYEKPAIVHTEEIEARAVQCSKADTAACSGPITS